MADEKRPERMAAQLDSRGSQNRPGRQQPAGDRRRQTPEESPGGAGRSPIEGQPPEHPVGTATGAVVGGAAGGVIGATGGPLGAVIGAGLGAVAGALAGRGVAESVNPGEEQAHWREEYARREYASSGRSFEAYEPAFRYGWEACIRHGGRSFDEVEDELGREWDSHRGRSDLAWMEARPAARDAWVRIQSRVRERGRSEGRIIT